MGSDMVMYPVGRSTKEILLFTTYVCVFVFFFKQVLTGPLLVPPITCKFVMLRNTLATQENSMCGDLKDNGDHRGVDAVSVWSYRWQ